MSEKYKNLKQYCNQKGICPEPGYWWDFWEIIEKRKKIKCAWEPPMPLVLASWHESPPFLKTIAFDQQLKWANEHEIIDEVDEFLRKLEDRSWYRL